MRCRHGRTPYYAARWELSTDGMSTVSSTTTPVVRLIQFGATLSLRVTEIVFALTLLAGGILWANPSQHHQCSDCEVYNDPFRERSDPREITISRVMEHNGVVNLSNSSISWATTDAGLEGIRCLILDHNPSRSLQIIRHFPNVTELYANNSDVTDISPAAPLIELTTLSVSCNKITSLGAIANSQQLRSLYAVCNRIASITPLLSLTSLKVLDLSYNNITSIKGIEVLSELEELVISGNPVSDLRPLLGMTQRRCKIVALDIQLGDLQAQEVMTDLTMRGYDVYWGKSAVIDHVGDIQAEQGLK
ncbi:MAG: hypothetical protein GHCLOJNM_00522 [bacterium]|nr:hypothetical protein [bacterium]